MAIQDDRTPAQIAHESAMTEVAETLANIEQAIRRTQKALAAVASKAHRSPARPALETALAQLTATRDALFRSAYFSGSAPQDHHHEVDVTDGDVTNLFPELDTPTPRPLF